MNAISLTLLLTSFAFGSILATDEKPVKSSLEKVTVYLQNARIKRTAKVQLNAGQNNIIFKDLSPNIVSNSVQITIKNETVGLRSVQASVENISLVAKDKKRISTINDSLEIISKAIQKIEIEKRSIQESQRTLKQNNPLGSNKTEGFTIEQLKAFMDMRREESQKHELELFELKEDILAQKNIKSRLNKEKKLLSYKTYKRHGVIRLSLDATKTSSSTVEISYLVSGASWTPIYDLRSASTNDNIQLKQKANVYQNTGVDWKNIKLSLSNANPNVDHNRPIMYPFYLALGTYAKVKKQKTKGYIQYNNNVQIQQTQSRDISSIAASAPGVNQVDEGEMLNSNGSRSRRNDTYVDGVRVTGTVGVPETEVTNLLETETEQVEIELAGNHTVKTGASAQLIEVKAHELNAEYEYYIIPKKEKAAFLLAKITDYAGLNLIPGPMNIFYEGTYLGQSMLNTSTPTDTLLLSLGRDEGISVQRVKMKKDRKTSMSTTKEEATFELKIRNNKSSTVNINVLDQVPVSTNDEIKIKATEIGNADYDKEIGRLRWTAELAPNKTFVKRFGYEVKYPKSKYVFKK